VAGWLHRQSQAARHLSGWAAPNAASSIEPCQGPDHLGEGTLEGVGQCSRIRRRPVVEEVPEAMYQDRLVIELRERGERFLTARHVAILRINLR
jgi:hypothetical protein